MKKLALLAAVIATLSCLPSAKAEDGKGQAAFQQKMADLGLSTEQKTQAQQIMAKGREDAKAVKENSSLTAETKQAKIQEIRKGTKQAFRAILTPEQIAKLKG